MIIATHVTRFSFGLFGLIAWGLLAFTYPAGAQDSPLNAKTEIVSAETTITVAADGTYVEEWSSTRRLLDISGRDSIATKTFRFNDQLSSIDVIEAETIKPDGRRIKVQPDQIRLQEDPAATGLPVFTTSKQKTIIFPDIEVGDSIHYRIKKTQREPDFPGQFSYTDFLFPDDRILSYKLTLKAPKNLDLQSEVRDFKEVRGTDNNGDKLWSWTFAQPDTRSVDDGKTDFVINSPHVIITSFRNWNAIAEAYRQRANDKVAVTPQIQTLANELTKGISDRREQTKVLYNWVRSNIRYVAIYLAQGGYVPHSAADILGNRYGDCKDHVVLLEALLRAKNIESHGALIASGYLFELPEQAMPNYFDHIITYVPEFDLYLDSTDQYLPFGVKTYPGSSKSVLHVDGVTGIRKTPAMTTADNKLATTMTMAIHEDGSIEGTVSEISGGGISIDRRATVASLDPLQRKDIIQKLLAQNGLRGKGSFTADDPNGDGTTYRGNVIFSADQTGLDLSNPEAFTITSPVPLGYTIDSLTNFATEREEPVYPTACAATDIIDAYEVTVPGSVKIEFLPKPAVISEGPIHYESEFSQRGQTISVKRKYSMSIDRGYCTPQDIVGMAKTAIKIRQDLQRKVMLVPAGN